MQYRGATPADMERLLPLTAAFAAERAGQMGKQLAEGYMDHLAPVLRMAVENPDAFVVVAEDGDTLCGYATVFIEMPAPILADDPYLFASDLYVVPDRRGQGIASDLLERARGWGYIKGVYRMSMVIPLANAAAQRVAAKTGFRSLEQLFYWEG